MDNKLLFANIDKLKTTVRGIERIKKNLGIDVDDVVAYCKNKILDDQCKIYQIGKNWYCDIDGIRFTINSHSYTIITAHLLKNTKKLTNQNLEL